MRQQEPATAATGLVRADLIEAQTIRSGLAATEHVLRGARSHLFLLGSGAGQILSDEDQIVVRAPSLNWFPRGQSVRVRLAAGTSGSAISIPDTLLGRSIPADSLAGHIRETIGYPLVNRPLKSEQRKKIGRLMEDIREELFANGPAASTVVQHTLTLLLIEIWRGFRPEISSPKPLPRRIVHTFMFLVDLHLMDHWTVQDYARHIGISKDRLNSAVRRATGRSPLAHIHIRMMSEAKTLLAESGLQVAEIAYKLGFRDAAYFNRFFQRHAGTPPGRFRNLVRKGKVEHDLSFAAWP